MAVRLRQLIRRQLLLERAGRVAFERGEAYFAAGRVASWTESNNQVDATVRGTRDYRVRLWLKGDRLQHACDCPFATEGAFCKHGVAAGLAFMSE